ncbi:flagellar biosynthesis protein FlhB [Echinimonas agarilytica]|uniref:Flagellar biosynthetic protein FlhB n=1 Tax=Echinimonas agarilytica TaxID=1215918 RepID=A0AA41W5G5_9GAMM|nr:flagellar biosynthesis protein FlhB [Echinimonas agarilytica]MCM2678980.1 flagellar biosynthesis protein FlhB [Echinimonas agarilytica]
MAETDQERTEEATPRKQEKAREKGQVPRSKELATAMVLISSAIGFLWFGRDASMAMQQIFIDSLTIERARIYDMNAYINGIAGSLKGLLPSMAAFMALVFICAFVGSIALGGLTVSAEAARPKLSKMSPLQGFKRMFGTQAVVELVKAIAKFSVVAVVAVMLLNILFPEILQLSSESAPGNIIHAITMFVWMFVGLCCSMLLIVVIDVPFQLYNHNKQLRMTMQEVKDEYKDTEGSPEIKRRIRRVQMEMAQRRMMGEVPNADVVVTNPDHFAVALRYDSRDAKAPVVVAKGIDFVAEQIKQMAREHEIPIMRQAALARAVYYTTELEKEIPGPLFAAVAQILAYVFQLKMYQKGKGSRPKSLNIDKEIPRELLLDQDGKQIFPPDE